MKKTIYIGLAAFFMLCGCSKSSEDLTANQNENLLRTATGFGEWDNTAVLQTGMFMKLATGAYSYASFPTYDFSLYYMNGETEYNANNYDLMAHFQYYSSAPVTNAIVEFTFPHISHFVPHITNANKHRIFTTNNSGNQTVITTVTNLTTGWNPMFCFMVKVDCGNSGLTTFWTDMKINGVSVKGTIRNKVFACN